MRVQIQQYSAAKPQNAVKKSTLSKQHNRYVEEYNDLELCCLARNNSSDDAPQSLINLQAFMPLAFFARCTFIPFQIPQTLRANVFPVCFVVLNFAAVRRYICCALALSERGHRYSARSPEPKEGGPSCVWAWRTSSEGRGGGGVRARAGGETQPRCMLGRG